MTEIRQSIATSLAVPDVRRVAQVVDRMFAFGRAFGVRIADPKEVAAIYVDVLSDVPVDLLEALTERFRTSWSWSNRLPMPAELFAMIGDEWGRRKRAAAIVELMDRLTAKRPAVAKRTGLHRDNAGGR